MALANAGFPCPPLAYVGGKAQFANRLAALFPYAPPAIVSPFIGGGSVECAMALRGVRVHGYDANPNLVGFWQALLDNPAALMDGALNAFGPEPLPSFRQRYRTCVKIWWRMPFTKERFTEMMQAIDQPHCYYVVNRASYSGYMRPRAAKFGCDEQRRAGRLRGFAMPPLSVARADFADSIPAHPDAFIYADPPHHGIGEALYAGAEGFDHAALRNALAAHRGQFAVSYNDCPEVRALYDGCHFTDMDFIYRMTSIAGLTRKGREAVIRNYR